MVDLKDVSFQKLTCAPSDVQTSWMLCRKWQLHKQTCDHWCVSSDDVSTYWKKQKPTGSLGTCTDRVCIQYEIECEPWDDKVCQKLCHIPARNTWCPYLCSCDNVDARLRHCYCSSAFHNLHACRRKVRGSDHETSYESRELFWFGISARRLALDRLFDSDAGATSCDSRDCRLSWTSVDNPPLRRRNSFSSSVFLGVVSIWIPSRKPRHILQSRTEEKIRVSYNLRGWPFKFWVSIRVQDFKILLLIIYYYIIISNHKYLQKIKIFRLLYFIVICWVSLWKYIYTKEF